MLTGETEPERMSRAFLTDGERAAVQDEREMDASTKSSHLSRVRGKMERMEEDAKILRQHRPELYEQLRDAVVEEELDERIERLERELEELRAKLEEDDG
jgi:chaperonin cofactor prefoldin